MPVNRRRVGVYIHPWHSFLRDVLLGLREAAAAQSWDLYAPWPGTSVWPDPAEFRLDGVIAAIGRAEDVHPDRLAGVPSVLLGSRRDAAHRRDVTWDNAAVGRLAAEHLLDQGHRQLAVWHEAEALYHRERAAGFAAAAEAAGASCRIIHDDHVDRLGKLRNLPTPCGLFCPTDRLAYDVLRLIDTLGWPVPERLALVAVGNEEDFCEFTAPPLSSVALPGVRAGKLVVQRLIERFEQPERHEWPTITVRPQFVAVRRSSDLLAMGDKHVVLALQQIRRHAIDGLTAAAVHEQSAISRRSLENRVREAIGRTIGQEITRVRFAQARDLLARTNLPIATIAARCGFSSPQRFTTAFTPTHGQSPASYRIGETPADR